jgi:hypothetical protein
MRRTTLVLAALAVMVAMLVALSAPALADDGKNNHHKGDNKGNNQHHGWDKWDKKWDNNKWHNNKWDKWDNNKWDDHKVNHFWWFNNFNDSGCWEWSWVFDRWEWDCD